MPSAKDLNNAGKNVLFFAASDNVSKVTDEPTYRWPFCYAHGQAVVLIREVQQAAGWPFEPDDVFISTTPFPEEAGEYKGTLYGMDCVVVIGKADGEVTMGRLALVPMGNEDLDFVRDLRKWFKAEWKL